MHDLIRLYATDRLAEEERAAGYTSVLAYYRHTADLSGDDSPHCPRTSVGALVFLGILLIGCAIAYR